MNEQKLILRVNELFHDLQGEAYEKVHPEIFKRESRRWQRLVSRFFQTNREHPLVVLDIGAGTGFVGTMLLPHMNPGDTLLCADISEEMLKICKQRLTHASKEISIHTLKMHDEHLPLEDESVDVVTLNSVLHHMPNPSLLLGEIMRVLKPKGLFFLGHEPNRLFYKNRALLLQTSAVHTLAPKRIIARLLRRGGQRKSEKVSPLLEEINGHLLHEGLIQKPLSPSELSALIDAHSPTAGGLRPEEGFDPYCVLDPWKGQMERVWVESYNHLGKSSGRHRLLKYYEAFLEWCCPQSGSTFFLVAKKI